MELKTYQRNNNSYMVSEYYQYLLQNDLIVDGSAGGLIQCPTPISGGIQLIQMNRDAEVFMAQKVEAWHFLINAFASSQYENEIKELCPPSVIGDAFFIPYPVSPSINTIIVEPKKIDGRLMTPYVFFGTNFIEVVGKQRAKEKLHRLNELNVAAWQTHFIEAKPTPTIRDTAVLAKFGPKNDN